MERPAARLCPVLPLPGRGGWRERAREYGNRICAREDGCEGTGGSPSLWSHPSPVCKEWCVCVCECARVRACVAVGGGVPGVLQHQTAPRGGARTRTTAPRLIPSLTPHPPASPASPGRQPPRSPPPARVLQTDRSRDLGPHWARSVLRPRPLRRKGAALRPARPEGARSCLRSEKRLS